MYLRVSAVTIFHERRECTRGGKAESVFTIGDGGNLVPGLLIEREHCRRHGFGGTWCAERVSCFHRSNPRIFYQA